MIDLSALLSQIRTGTRNSDQCRAFVVCVWEAGETVVYRFFLLKRSQKPQVWRVASFVSAGMRPVLLDQGRSGFGISSTCDKPFFSRPPFFFPFFLWHMSEKFSFTLSPHEWERTAVKYFVLIYARLSFSLKIIILLRNYVSYFSCHVRLISVMDRGDHADIITLKQKKLFPVCNFILCIPL